MSDRYPHGPTVGRVPELAAAEERWRLTIDNAPVGIALVGLDGHFLRVNAALCRILGYPADDLLALDFQQLTHPDDLDTDLHFLEQLVAGDIPSYRMRKRYLHAQGHHVWADLSVSLVRDSEGTPIHFVSHVADLTEEVEAADRIEQVNRELNEQQILLERSNADLEAFAMLASHDLQAPLATIRGYMELLEATYEDTFDERATEWVGRITQATDRMSELVNSLLDFSRAGTTQERETVAVVDLVDEVRRDLDQLIKETDAEVLVAPDAPAVFADRSRLRQVLQNLIQNSLKHRHPQRAPRCDVGVEEREADWLVTVTDNALGIPAEHRESIFTMYTRVGGAGTGHGIGLAACRQIVERHGGAIWVDGTPRGEGSRFSFTLPR
jgi:PAS domain S-box-containing protein